MCDLQCLARRRRQTETRIEQTGVEQAVAKAGNSASTAVVADSAKSGEALLQTTAL